MADDADRAADLEFARVEVGLARIAAAIPNGVVGECEECGEAMPRLVNGRCGFCRDGRRPPLSYYDIPRPSPPAHPVTRPPKETHAMPTAIVAPDAQTISVPAKGAVLAAIKARADLDREPLGRSAAAIIADWIASAPSSPALDEASVDDLLDALRARLARGVSALDHDLAVARAEAAEARLELIGGVISGKVAPVGASS